MKRLFFPVILLLVSGCIPVIVGAGAAVGYTLSNDSAIGEIKGEYRNLWDVATDVTETMKAENVLSNESKGLIKAIISGYDVTIKIDQISQELQKLKVSARKYLIPKPHFAQKIFVKIVEELK